MIMVIMVVLLQLRIFCASVKFKHIVQLLSASMAEKETSTLCAFNPFKLTYIPISNSVFLLSTSLRPTFQSLEGIDFSLLVKIFF